MYDRMIDSELNLNHQTVYDILTKELGVRTLGGCCMKITFPVNTAISMKGSLDQKVYFSGSEAQYSTDLSPCNFFLFLRLKFHLKGRHFETGQHPKVVTDQLRVHPHEDFQHCYQE
jgi:hypothetical protein